MSIQKDQPICIGCLTENSLRDFSDVVLHGELAHICPSCSQGNDLFLSRFFQSYVQRHKITLPIQPRLDSETLYEWLKPLNVNEIKQFSILVFALILRKDITNDMTVTIDTLWRAGVLEYIQNGLKDLKELKNESEEDRVFQHLIYVSTTYTLKTFS